MSNKPLVSIGLPTYNRDATLRRAIESALNQDYQNIELLISDNASTDKTEAICLDAARQDNRVKYFRQQTNLGAIANFREVLRQSGGEFFMWLADDDWLDPNYVSRCVQVLLEEPDHVIACGVARHCNDHGRVIYDGDRINLPQASGRERILEYLRLVRNDGLIYALMRREHLLREPLKNTLAGDWLLTLSIVFTGKAKMLYDTHLYRSDRGVSATMKSTVEGVGVSPLYARSHNLFYLRIAISVFWHILVVSPSFKSIGIMERFSLACAAFLVIQKGFNTFQFPSLIARARRILHWVRGKVIIRTR